MKLAISKLRTKQRTRFENMSHRLAPLSQPPQGKPYGTTKLRQESDLSKLDDLFFANGLPHAKGLGPWPEEIGRKFERKLKQNFFNNFILNFLIISRATARSHIHTDGADINQCPLCYQCEIKQLSISENMEFLVEEQFFALSSPHHSLACQLASWWG